ncbi:Fatty-acid amide hydrolase 2-A, partial [Armadillidium nasatum]
VTSEEVVNAFIERIKEVNPILNALVQERFEDARKEARDIDTFISTSGKTVKELEEEKPLLGVPFTVKDFYGVKGLKHTCGMWGRRENVAEEDAECVRLMKEAGAICLGVTNVPEFCMWWETHNTIYGRTNCPYDVNRIAGGSSGGEGSLQSACGTPLSIGSDIAGSIRFPSFFNGVFGHKPTSDVVSNKGAEPNLIGLHNSLSVTGPICKYVDDISLMYRVLAGKNLGLLSLDKKVDLKNINIYYMENDGGDPLLPRVNPEITFAQRKILKHFEDEFKISPVKVNFKQLVDARKIYFAKLFSEKEAHSYAFEYGNRKNLLGDNGVFIYPTQPKNDIYHNGTLFCYFVIIYTGIWNLLGVPSIQCPLGLGSNRLPLGVQVIGNKYQDHLCLAVAKEIEKTFGGWVNPSKVSTDSES